jgi:putative ABC transport system permease protein
VTPAADAMTAEVRPALQILLAAVALLLATATANVGGLQLARATVRRREIAVRAAIGAGRARIVRQLVVESSVLAAAGACAGMALVVALHRALPALLPPDFPRVGEIAIDPHVLAFALAIVAATSVVCGLLPAAQLARVDVAAALAEESAASAAGAWRSRSARMRSAVMAAQIAVACVLLVGAALLARSFVALMRADRGYDPSHVLTARVDLPRRYDGAARAAFADRVIERIRSSPRVVHAAAGNALPFVSGGGSVGFKMPSPSNPSVMLQVQTLTRLVSPEYFHALRLRLIAGRLLSDADTLTTRPAIVVNRSFAQRYLGSSPLGARVPLAFGEGRPDGDVVGIVDDMRQGDVTDPPAAETFASYRQMPARLLNGPLVFIVRTDDDPTRHAAALRTAVREQDGAAPVDSIVTLDERVMTSLAKPRLYAALLIGFAVAALAIAGVGLFGVLSYSVSQRSREIGVRTALGAQRGDVIALVLRQATAVALAGVAAGLLASFASSAYLAAFLYGVASHDPATFAAAGVTVIVVAGLACVVPARRAAAVDPVVVLKG